MHGKVVGRCPRLSVKVEQMAVSPCRHTVAADADGNIPLQYHPQFACRVVGPLHLPVQQILQPGVEQAAVGHIGVLGSVGLQLAGFGRIVGP